MKRSNQQWLDDLRGVNGKEAQNLAINDLLNYSYKVAYNFLTTLKKPPAKLNLASDNEIKGLAEDFAQITLTDLCANHFAKLDKYRHEGNFTSWVASICQYHIRNKLARARWREVPFQSTSSVEEEPNAQDHAEDQVATEEATPEESLMKKERDEQLERCWAKLSPNEQAALLGKSQGMRSAEIAKTIPGATAALVDLWAHRGREKLRKCMEAAGYHGWRL